MSKVCSVWSPVFIGVAAQSLIAGRIDYLNISLYCATAMGTQLFKELQKVVYLGVKQIAFVEISGEK